MDKKTLETIIRVNHAGEYGAKRIYEGQLAFIKDAEAKAEIKKMLDNELIHLDFFTEQLKKYHGRPTAFYPLWHILGYTLGLVTAFMGKEAAMATTVAVENIIADHYQKQIKILNNSSSEEIIALKEKIKEFREDEIKHKNIAENDVKTEMPLLDRVVGCGSKLAIWLSERF